MKITPELQADRPTYSDTEQGYEIQVRRDAGCRVSCAGFSSVTGNAYVSMSYRWFNEYKLSFLFGVGAFLISFFKIYFAFYIRRRQDV